MVWCSFFIILITKPRIPQAIGVDTLIYLFIYFAKRPGSLTEQARLRVPEKKKEISNTTKQNDNTLETTKKKKKQKCKNRIGEDIDKKSTTHTIEQAVQWPTSVALNTHTLKGLGGVDIINRLSEIQVITTEQSVFRRWVGKVFQILGALQ